MTIEGLKLVKINFTDEEHARLLKAKDGMTWHDFVMQLASREEGT